MTPPQAPSAAELQAATAAHRAAPDEAAPAFRLCRLLLEARDPAANVMLGTLVRFAGYGQGWEDLGHCLAALHPGAARVAFGRAAKAYEAAEAATPNATLAYRLGAVLRQGGDLMAACAALERATARDPAFAAAWFALGLVRQDGRDRAGAIAAFRAALAAQPAYHEAAFNLAVVLQEAGSLDGALDQYAIAWRLRPDSFGRIAQALVSPAVGRLWLDPGALQRELVARA